MDDTVQGSTPTTATAHDRRVLRWVSTLVQLQGIALSLLCIAFGVYALGGHDTHHGIAQAELLFAVGLGAGVGWTIAGRALGRGVRAAYSPLVLLELICLPVAWGLIQGHHWGYALLVGVPALVVIVVLFGPVGRRVVSGSEDE